MSSSHVAACCDQSDSVQKLPLASARRRASKITEAWYCMLSLLPRVEDVPKLAPLRAAQGMEKTKVEESDSKERQRFHMFRFRFAFSSCLGRRGRPLHLQACRDHITHYSHQTTFKKPKIQNTDFIEGTTRRHKFNLQLLNVCDIVPHLPSCIFKKKLSKLLWEPSKVSKSQ